MDARFYNSDDIDIERLGLDLVNIYLAQHYQAQSVGGKDQVMVQIKKGGDFEAILGMQAALTVTLQRTAGGVLAMIGQQKWIDKAAVGAVGIAVLPLLWPLALTAGVGALRQASLGNQVLNMTDNLVRQQRPNVVAGPIPAQLVPQMQQQWAPPTQAPYYTPPAATPPPPPQPVQPVVRDMPRPASPPAPAAQKLRCQYCNTPHEPGDTFCTGCGRSLTPPKVYCSQCHAELKTNTSFCANCGSSTFQAVTASNQTIPPKPAPVIPTPTISYTAPQAVQPAPPVPAIQPATPAPYYTPKPAVPPQPVSPPPVVVPPPPAPRPTPPPVAAYVPPPQMQEPPVKPQPKVTLMPGTANPATASITPPPPTQQQTYYVPSTPAPSVPPTVQALPPTSSSSTTAATEQPTVAEIPYYTPPSSTPAEANQPTIEGTGPKAPAQQAAATDPWGTLTFSDGTTMQLHTERAIVGRYDHDLDGIMPEIDLQGIEGADTVSRAHAALEHSGTTSTLTDLNSTNASRVNGKRLEPDKPVTIVAGDTLQFGKIVCTFRTL